VLSSLSPLCTLAYCNEGLFNVLGVFKVGILIFIVFSGFAALGGHLKIPKPDNLQDAFKWHDFGGGVYNYATALLRIVYSYKGY
jgi:hypothetical protein